MKVQIKNGTIPEAISVSKNVPEFIGPPEAPEYERRLAHVPHLILIAWMGGQPVGFKVGYERDPDGSFYSWLGGVLPKFRTLGIAKQLADAQEKWAWERGYHTVRFKTRNSHTAMQIFALKNGFKIIDLKKRDKLEEHRILLEKNITRS